MEMSSWLLCLSQNLKACLLSVRDIELLADRHVSRDKTTDNRAPRQMINKTTEKIYTAGTTTLAK